MIKWLSLFICFFMFQPSPVLSLPEDITEVSFKESTIKLREHPKTKTPYVVVTYPDQQEPKYDFQKRLSDYQRPNYGYLENSKLGYEGPVSDRKKVTIFAASLITSGVVVAAAGPAVASSVAAAGTGSGLGYAVAGAAVASGSLWYTQYRSRETKGSEGLIKESGARLLPLPENK